VTAFSGLQFADSVALWLALRRHDAERLEEQLELGRDGAIALVNFATVAWQTYAEARGLSFGDLPPPPPRG
jgi:hypothetical protein